MDRGTGLGFVTGLDPFTVDQKLLGAFLAVTRTY